MHDSDDVSPSRSQHVLMLSSDYPPLAGGARVQALATALAGAGHEVTVVTRHAPGAATEEYVHRPPASDAERSERSSGRNLNEHGVRVVRGPDDRPLTGPSTPTLLASTMAVTPALTRAGLDAAASSRVDVIHAHDWGVAHTAATLREHLNLPLVVTFGATEAGRNQGWLSDDSSRTVHSIQRWLAHQANRIIAFSEHLRDEVTQLLDVPTDRIDVVPTGVDSAAWQAPARPVAAARARFAEAGPLIGYAGRLVHEKGVQDLIAAMPVLRALHPGVRLVVAGVGPYLGVLREEVRRRKLHRAVSFTGWLAQPDLAAVMAATDAFVLPSIYEPVGTVALEAACAGTPLAVAATGALTEIVQCGTTGMTFPPMHPRALAGAVSALLDDEMFGRRIAKQAQAMVAQRYDWHTAARRTAAVYAAAVRDAARVGAGPARAGKERSRPMRILPTGILLARTAS